MRKGDIYFRRIWPKWIDFSKRKKIQKVYEYYYGDCKHKLEVSRLETILKKLNYLITREEENKLEILTEYLKY